MTILKDILEARGSLLEHPGRGMGYGRMMHGGKCPYAGTVMKGECPGCTGVGTDLSMGAKDPMSEAVDEIDTADFKLNKAGKKTKAHKIVFRTGEDETQIKDDTTKVHEETGMKKTYKEFTEMYGVSTTDAEINEVLSKDAAAGEWISDFVHSDNPKFAGKSKEKRKQMALAAYYAKQKNEEISFTGSHQGKTTMKHIKNPTVQQRMAAHDIKPGVAGYRDRIDLLKDAERTGKMKKEEVDELDEVSLGLAAKVYGKRARDSMELDRGGAKELAAKAGDKADNTFFRIAKKFGPKGTKAADIAFNTEDLDEASSYLAINPKTRMVDKVCDTKEERDEYIKSKGGTHMAMQTPKGQKKVGDKYMREDIDEAYWPDPKDAVSAKPTSGRITRTQHRVKTTDTGAIYTKEYDPAGISKGSGAAAAEPKRGRGRPKKDKFAESFAALLAMNETQFDMFAESLSEEAFDAFTAALKV